MTDDRIPVTADVHATAQQVLAAANADYAHTNAVAAVHQQQGGDGHREGVLPGTDT
ncbi:hypothetical protein ACKI14_02545 [Streptomyces turgidiscabies]|uniref:hypothetical protein n=1 Tax=Streptomyces turgidiscabies TaxID=85558 RepID=UPI0038F815B8